MSPVQADYIRGVWIVISFCAVVGLFTAVVDQISGSPYRRTPTTCIVLAVATIALAVGGYWVVAL